MRILEFRCELARTFRTRSLRSSARAAAREARLEVGASDLEELRDRLDRAGVVTRCDELPFVGRG
ncbi:hypothetical protein G6O46_24845, partial [Salmonella enterica subsp. enterica serovar Enteritidis]|uniref:hypothetical protein n=1 Tax=Salmonella enterica TaxID=28901 RepID=UPI0016540CA5